MCRSVREPSVCAFFFARSSSSSSVACAKFHNFCERLARLLPLVWCLAVTCHSYRAINKPVSSLLHSEPFSVGMEHEHHRLLSRNTRSHSHCLRSVSIYFYGNLLVHSCIGDTFCAARATPPSHLLTENTFSCVKCMTSEADTDVDALKSAKGGGLPLKGYQL